jgi:hypothetical protein
LFDEVTCLVEANSVAFSIAHSLTNAEIIFLPGMTVSSGAFELINRFLL